MNNELVVIVRGQRLSGWTEIRLGAGIERVPRDFDLGCTEKFPNSQDIVILPGDACTITIGGTTVLTGYVDQYANDVAADRHNIRIRGRSKCEDVVDCSAGIDEEGTFFGNFQSSQTALQLATLLAQPFGISVSNQSGSDGNIIPPFFINEGETAFEVIERISRYAGFLSYDDANGNLVLASPGQSSMASGFTQGLNVQSAAIGFSMNQRYSDYWSVWQSIDGQQDTGPYNTNGYAQDAGVKSQGRFRPIIIVSEQVQLGTPIGQARCIWEANRRWGRSQAVRVTCDSWRDTAGTLWQPNAYAPIYLPSCKVTGKPSQGNGWVISEVTYNLNLNGGTTADVVLMPDLAFSIEPVVLAPFAPDIATGLANASYGGGAAP